MRLIIAQSDQVEVVPEEVTTGDWLLAVGILIAAVVLAQISKRLLRRTLVNTGVEEPSARALGRWVSYAIVLAGVASFLVILQVRIGPLLATLTAISVAIAFAVQDDLRNLWSGIQIQTRRPFRIGDEIATGEWVGTVEAVDLRATTLLTRDGKHVDVPNANVMLRGIDNRTETPTRRTTLRVGVAYDTNLERAQQVIVDALAAVPEIETEPSPSAYVEEFGESAINFAARFWHGAETPEMWRARSAAAIAIKKALDEAGIMIAFPQRTVWIKQSGEA